MISNLSHGENERFTMENEGNIISVGCLIEGGIKMIVKYKSSDRIAWWVGLICFCALICVIALGLYDEYLLIPCGVLLLIVSFPHAFSSYEFNEQGVNWKCAFINRFFTWDDFKFIGKQHLCGGGTPPRDFIRCCTVPLPKDMTEKKLEKKIFWPLFRTITIEWQGEVFYQDFLQYCGGERDDRSKT